MQQDEDLEFFGMCWLAYDRRCIGVCRERQCRFQLGEPDILGLLPSRYTIEIEIKRSMADFYANKLKRHIRFRESLLEIWPRQFYFLVPPNLVASAKKALPEWAGLATINNHGINGFTVISVAPVNKESKKLTIFECAKMMRGITKHVIKNEEMQRRWKTQFRDGVDWYAYQNDYRI
jgi:hypothetical protein